MLSKSAYAVVGFVVVALSFSATVFALNLWSGYPISEPLSTASIPTATPVSPAPPATPGAAQETPLEGLPKVVGSGFQWVNAVRLNVRAETKTSVVTGQPILLLIPTSQDGFHTLAGQFTGLDKSLVYRVMAWVKPVGGGNIQLEVADQPNGKPLNYATGLFDLTDHTVLSAGGAIKDRGVEQGPGEWQKVWLNVTTSDGQFVVVVRPASGGAESFKGDGTLGVILGGVEVDPQG